MAGNQDVEEYDSSLVFVPQYVGQEASTGKFILIKRTRVPETGGLPAVALREVYFLKFLRSEYVRELLDVVLAPTSLYVVVQGCGRTLLDIISDSPHLITLTYRRKVALHLCKCLEFLQDQGVLHLDISPDFVLIDEEQKVRLEGFYRAQHSDQLKNRPNRPNCSVYMSPELISGQPPTSACDMWAFAITLLAMIKKDALNWTGNRSEIEGFIRPYLQPQGETALRQAVPEATFLEIDFLRQVLRTNPAERLTAKQALQHAYFDEENSGEEEE